MVGETGLPDEPTADEEAVYAFPEEEDFFDLEDITGIVFTLKTCFIWQ